MRRNPLANDRQNLKKHDQVPQQIESMSVNQALSVRRFDKTKTTLVRLFVRHSEAAGQQQKQTPHRRAKANGAAVGPWRPHEELWSFLFSSPEQSWHWHPLTGQRRGLERREWMQGERKSVKCREVKRRREGLAGGDSLGLKRLFEKVPDRIDGEAQADFNENAQFRARDSQGSDMKPPNTFPPVSKTSVSVFASPVKVSHAEAVFTESRTASGAKDRTGG
jgi:hypothetical protein